jgi:hypothetical protein
MIDYRTPPLGYLVRIPQESIDSPLDASARLRAEDAARFLSFEKFGMVCSCHHVAAVETAEIIAQSCAAEEPHIDGSLIEPWTIQSYLSFKALNGFPHVLVCAPDSINAAIARMTGASVCGGIVAPGGIISIHRDEGKIVARARHMLDFKFTDFVESVSAGPQ